MKLGTPRPRTPAWKTRSASSSASSIPRDTAVAIGFTGQRPRNVRIEHLGGTRGPLHSHLLVREGVNRNTEAEHLEVLVHELGHYLGAAHSPEPTSVMRGVLGDRRARAAKFAIQFDPLNTLAMCLVSQELEARPLGQLSEASPRAQVELLRLYRELDHALPNDPTAKRYLDTLSLGAQQAADRKEQ